MTRRDAASLLVVAAVAWAAAARGGTRAVDLVVVTGLLLVALATAPRPARPRPTAALVAVAGLELWLLAAGTRDGAVDLATLRVPALVLIAVLAVLATRRLDGRQRATVVGCLVLVGTVQAGVAVGQVALAWSAGPIDLPPRATGLVGNPNALGVVLAATGALTLRALAHRPTRLLRAALAVQAAGLLLTGSRLALLVAMLVLVVCAPRRVPRPVAVAAAVWALAALAVVVARFAVTGWDRAGLWAAALREIARHPLAGRGAEPVVLDVPGSPVGPTTHAHNEVLQLAVEYGLVGVALAALSVVLAVRSPGRSDRWLVAATGALLAGGLADVGLRVTALALATALVATMALDGPATRPTPTGSRLVTRRPRP